VEGISDEPIRVLGCNNLEAKNSHEDEAPLSECQNSRKWAGGLMPYVVG
jgi:hypothetical protein